MKKILIFSSGHTGAGHQSISDALMEQFSGMQDVEAQTVDGFEVLGCTGLFTAGLYGFETRHVRAVYNAVWKYTMVHPLRFSLTARLYGRRIMECIRLYRPDLILTVHSLFNTLLTVVLKRHGLNIPVVVLQADLVNIHSSWCNPDAYRTLCPTREAYESSIRQGMLREKLTVMGFPVRSRFCDAAGRAEGKNRDVSHPPRCLLMSGAEGCGRLKAYAEAILDHTDAVLTIVCGRNRKLQTRLRKTLGAGYGGRVNVLGFVPDMERLMLGSDLLISRGSPNTLLEAIALKLPVLLTGPVPEQEKGNAQWMQERGFGVLCGSPAEAPRMIRSLLDHDAARLREIRAAQQAFRCSDSARKIAGYVAKLAHSDAPVNSGP